jgi:N-acetylneuraminic acid mutarotase
MLRTPGRGHFRRVISGGMILGAAALTILVGLTAAHATSPATGATPPAAGPPHQDRHDLMLPPDRLDRREPILSRAATRAPLTEPIATTWASVPDFPTQIQDNVAGFANGTVYTVSGWTGHADTADMYSFTPGDAGWTKLASAPTIRAGASGAFIDGKLYVTDGWNTHDQPTGDMDIYDPATNRWTTGAPSPKPVAAAATAVVNGKLYTIGGCGASQCGTVSSVEVYDPHINTWRHAAHYPVPTAFAACGGIAGQIYCAGGSNDQGGLKSAYVYNQQRNKWTRIPSLPVDTFGASYTAANGQLLVQDGLVNNASRLTNEGWSYNPATRAWTPLPAALTARVRGGSSLGFYQIGGSGAAAGSSLASAEVLAGLVAP